MRLEGKEFARGLGFPEGPIALSDGSILLVEIEGGRLTRLSPSGQRETIAELGGGPNGAAIGPDGRCYVCNNGGFAWHKDDTGYLRPIGRAEDYRGGRIERVDLATGEVKILYHQCDGVPLRILVLGSRQELWATIGSRRRLLRSRRRIPDQGGDLPDPDAERRRPLSGRAYALRRGDGNQSALEFRHRR
jgi:hypothetical protein